MARADAQLEIGGFVGAHVFSGENELGVDDVLNPDSPGSSIAPGLRAAFSPFSLLALEGELTLMPATSRMSDTSVQVLGFRAQGLLQLMGTKRKFRPFALFGIGGMRVDPSASMSMVGDEATIQKDLDTMLHVGTGIKYRVFDSWGARADVRLLFPPSTSGDALTTDWEFFFGIYKTFGGGGSGSVHAPRPMISDNDDDDGATDLGWLESDEEPKVKARKLVGAALSKAEMRRKLSIKAADAKAAANGTPRAKRSAKKTKKPDGDNDGIPDDADACPDVAEDHDRYLDHDGCPEPDNDGDLIADVDDRCPRAAETENGYKDTDGCPDKLPQVVSLATGTVTGITFVKKSSKLSAKAAPVLDRIAAAMLKHKTTRFELQAHTSIPGRRGRKLSTRRARAAKDYLVGHGIEADRVVAKGYGAAFPIASNATAAGRARNARIGLKLLVTGVRAEQVCGKKSKDPECRKDGDKDGVVDALDMCPMDPEDVDNFIDADGCPEPDNDADSFADDQDKCPLKAENRNGYKDDDGCPDRLPAAIASLIGTVPGINFRPGSTSLAPGSAARLNKLASLLRRYPGVRLEVQVHTFAKGSEKAARKLTQRQAEALKYYLAKAGVSDSRLEAVGYGSAHPVASNRSKDRFKNRRVSLRLLVDEPDDE